MHFRIVGLTDSLAKTLQYMFGGDIEEGEVLYDLSIFDMSTRIFTLNKAVLLTKNDTTYFLDREDFIRITID